MKGRGIAYSAAELAWLEENRMMVISDYHAAFQARLGRPDVSADNLHSLRKRKGWKVGRAGGRLAGRSRLFSRAELAWLSDNRSMLVEDCRRAFCEAFAREDVTAAQIRTLRKNRKWASGQVTRFAKGQTPPNKGRRCAPGTGGLHPNARKTQFRRGAVPHNSRGPGHESLGDDGYWWIVTARRNPWTGAATWRVHKHRWLWEQANGPVPKGHALKCVDGDKLNCDPSNWVLVPKGLLPRLNGRSGRAYDAAPAELKPLIMTVAKLEHTARQRAGGRKP